MQDFVCSAVVLDDPDRAPTPVNDSSGQAKCTIREYSVVANDPDPDGDYPLTLVSVTGIGFSVASSTTLEFNSGISMGTKTGTCTVRDSLGATATGKLFVSVSGGSCMEPPQ